MICRLISAIAASAALVSSSVAQEASLYEPPTIEMRLLDGGVDSDGSAQRLAGVEIRLEGGWKTYWRRPGDSGLPPNFDFSGSTNVDDVAVLWPAPSVSHDGYGWVIGYSGEVVFPLLVTPSDPGMPVELAVDLAFAVCADICVPLHADDLLRLNDDGPDRVPIDFYRELVPAMIDDAGSERGVRAIRRLTDDEIDILELTVRVGGRSGNSELIVEGPQSWQVGVAEHVGRSGDTETFRLAPDWELPSGSAIVVTGVSPSFAFEQRVAVP